MLIIEPKVIIEAAELSTEKLINIERRGRVCYQSAEKITAESAAGFIRKLIKREHESVLEHEKITVHIICDRGVTHEIVRHRIASYSQESTRYCNYSAGKFGEEITVIRPFFFPVENIRYAIWEAACDRAERQYFALIQEGSTPQEARSVLPNSLKTEIAVTFNMREWRHFFKLRCAKAAHPQMRQITIPLLLELQRWLPTIFDGIGYDHDFDSQYYAEIEVLA